MMNTRRRGVRRWLIRFHGLHPIRDRAIIDAVLPILYAEPAISLDEAMRRAGLVAGSTGPSTGR